MSRAVTIVGTGIESISHLTEQAKAYIESSDKVLYLVNEPILADWIKSKNAKSESLDACYFSSDSRKKSYTSIADKVIDESAKVEDLCVVFYGNPGFLCDPAFAIWHKAKENSIDCVILPAVSSLDCLATSLGRDIIKEGCQIYEANKLVNEDLAIETKASLIVMQPYSLGRSSILSEGGERAKGNLEPLRKKLLRHYTEEHEMFICEVSQYPHIESSIVKTIVGKLSSDQLDVTPLTTLFIPT